MDVPTFKLQISEGPVVVQFSSRDCKPCHDIAPFIDEMVKEYSKKIEFRRFKVDVDDNFDVFCEFVPKAVIPALQFYHNGEMIESFVGTNKEEMKQKFEYFVSSVKFVE